jgi:hypothetical protein
VAVTTTSDICEPPAFWPEDVFWPEDAFWAAVGASAAAGAVGVGAVEAAGAAVGAAVEAVAAGAVWAAALVPSSTEARAAPANKDRVRLAGGAFVNTGCMSISPSVISRYRVRFVGG